MIVYVPPHLYCFSSPGRPLTICPRLLPRIPNTKRFTVWGSLPSRVNSFFDAFNLCRCLRVCCYRIESQPVATSHQSRLHTVYSPQLAPKQKIPNTVDGKSPSWKASCVSLFVRDRMKATAGKFPGLVVADSLPSPLSFPPLDQLQ